MAATVGAPLTELLEEVRSLAQQLAVVLIRQELADVVTGRGRGGRGGRERS